MTFDVLDSVDSPDERPGLILVRRQPSQPVLLADLDNGHYFPASIGERS